MQPTKTLIALLERDFPKISFVAGDNFGWSAKQQRITYKLYSTAESWHYTLHELAHALLDHHDFQRDIELIGRERAAWDYTKQTLAPRYGVEFTAETAENALETYREWLYCRSLCPRCNLHGLQTTTSTYVCVNCRCSWRPNDARQCVLRRYVVI